MQRALFFKFLIIFVLAMLLFAPLSMIRDVIQEREYYRDNVIKDISESWTGSQTITSAILVAPFQETVKEEAYVYDKEKKTTVFVEKEKILHKNKYFLPETLNIDGVITTEERYRGIYKVPVYLADLKLDGQFNIPKSLGITENIANITWQRPYIVFGIKDIRGITRSVQLQVNGQDAPLRPGTLTSAVDHGVHALLEADYQQDRVLKFNAAMELQGMERLSFLPTGRFTKVSLSSPWPHPSFVGRFLPKTREISDDGFTARWETSFFASNMQQLLNNCTEDKHCRPFENNSFGVSLHQGVDIYLQAERSVKYAILFVGLTFVAFFLFEMLKALRIHAIQYGLVGVALALFYLLLISLSEHIAFALAYVIAAAACVSLLAFYVSYMLRSVTRGLIFAGAMAGLYGALFMLIRSEDYALLLGSALLFSVLTFIMVITRHVDWYKIAADAKEQLSRDKAKAVATE